MKTDAIRTVTITYLEMTGKLSSPLPPPRPKGQLALLRVNEPPLHFYRYLFDQIGAPYQWVSRRYMSDEELRSHIHDPDVHLYVLYFNGAPCGMGEIDIRRATQQAGDAEIKFFGLMPDFVGQGLGRWFLQNIIDLAWALNPRRVVLETCTADHPAALSLYQKMGFSVYRQSEGIIEWKG
ncbi:MAG: GNAT family N-acetyltransferase [bacterium]